jgi:hypothetical protein
MPGALRCEVIEPAQDRVATGFVEQCAHCASFSG